jgi:hypothetical protein
MQQLAPFLNTSGLSRCNCCTASNRCTLMVATGLHTLRSCSVQKLQSDAGAVLEQRQAKLDLELLLEASLNDEDVVRTRKNTSMVLEERNQRFMKLFADFQLQKTHIARTVVGAKAADKRREDAERESKRLALKVDRLEVRPHSERCLHAQHDLESGLHFTCALIQSRCQTVVPACQHDPPECCDAHSCCRCPRAPARMLTLHPACAWAHLCAIDTCGISCSALWSVMHVAATRPAYAAGAEAGSIGRKAG